MKLQIRVDDDGIISDVKFKTFGCGSAIASSSYLTELVRGMSLDEAGKVKNTAIAKELSLPPVKRMSLISILLLRCHIYTNILGAQCIALCLPKTLSNRRSRTTKPSAPSTQS